MVETCYSRGKKILLASIRNRKGKWMCRFTIPGLVTPENMGYQDSAPEEYETEGEAKAAAFESAKRVLDSSHEMTHENNPGRAL